MKLFTPLALSASAYADVNCGQVTYTNTKTISQVWSFGSYATGYANYENDWKANFFKNILSTVYTAKCHGIAALNPDVTCGDVTVYDIKNDFLDCNVGKWCTQINLRASITFNISKTVDLECEGSADLPDDDDMS